MGSLNLLWVFDKVNQAFYSSLIDAKNLAAENRGNCTKSAYILKFVLRGVKDRRPPSGIGSSTSYLALNGHSQNSLSVAVPIPPFFLGWWVRLNIKQKNATQPHQLGNSTFQNVSDASLCFPWSI